MVASQPEREAFPWFSLGVQKKRRQPFDCLLQYPLRGSNDEVVARIPIKQSADRRSNNKSPSYPRNPYYVSNREGTIWWRSAEGRCSIGGDAGSLLTKHLPPILCRSVQLRHQTKKRETFVSRLLYPLRLWH